MRSCLPYARPALFLLALLPAYVRAQNEAATPEAGAAESSIYVRDSGVAVEKFDLAGRLERQKQWDKAADVYQEIATKFADRVIPSRYDAGKPIQYVSAARVAQENIGKWPEEGLAAYRRRFEDTARDLLETAGDDPRVPGRVMNLYFVTDAGRDAALRVMATDFEAGEFAAAAAVGRRLLDGHPALVAERPRVLLQTALAQHQAGRTDEARKALDELRTRFPDAIVRVAGQDAKATDILDAALATAVPTAGGFRSEDWPVPFGNASASAVPEQISGGGARMFAVDLPGTLPRTARNAAVMREYQKRTALERRSGQLTGVLPSVDGGTLYFSDNARVWAINLSSGLPLPGWQQSHPGDKGGAFSINAAPTPRGKQSGVSVTEQGVIALLGQYDSLAANTVGYAQSQPPQVVCLDRLTGRPVWATSVARLKLPDDLNNLREGVFYGTPVVDGDSVYALVNANRGNQFDECYVVALGLADGAFRWASYVASTSRLTDIDNVGEFGTASTAAVSLANGRLFVLTNLGALACLATADGSVQWLNVYDRPPVVADPRRMFIRPRTPGIKPFALSPPVVTGGRVFALPVDSKQIYVVDAADGTVLREIPRQLDAKFPAVQSIVGVVGDWLLLTNPSTLFRVPWKTYDPAKSLVDNDGRYKTFPAADDRTNGADDSIRGRPFLSADSVLVPTGERLYRVGLQSFKTESEYPSQGKWDEEESPGNVLATPETLIIAGPSRVNVYADLAVATAKLDARLANDPKDVEAYLRYAELLFTAGQPRPALARLDAAAERLGGLPKLTPGPTRDRLFEIASNFAVKPPRGDNDSAISSDLFDRATAAASTPQQHVRVRLSRAAVHRAAGRAADEVALHQQILANPAWRSTPVAGHSGPSVAGVEATAAIRDLIRQHGASVYAPYEAAATAQLAQIKQADKPDPATLVALAETYPAASLTPDVLQLAAEQYEQVRQPRLATQTLRQLLKRDLSNERRQIVLQALARNYLMVPNQVATAQVRLRQAKDRAPLAKLVQPLTLPDGRPVAATTLAEAVAALDAYRADAQKLALPTFGAPRTSTGGDFTKPPLRPAEEIGLATAVIGQQTDILRGNRVVVYGKDRRIGVITGDSGAVAWSAAAPTAAPVGCGFVGDTLVVVAAGEVVAIDAAGKVLWSVAANGLSPSDLTPGTATEKPAENELDVNGVPPIINNRVGGFGRPWGGARRGGVRQNAAESDDEQAAVASAEQFALFRVLSDRVVVSTNTGRLLAIDLATGQTAWQARVSDLPAGRLLSNDDFIAVSFSDGPVTGSEVYVFDAVTGQTLQHKTYDGNTNPQAGGLVNLALSPDGMLVTMLAGRLVGTDLYEPADGDRRRDVAPPTNPGDQPFIASGADDQFVIAGNRVLAVYNSRNGQQSVHAYDLRTLRPITTNDARAAEIAYGPRGSDPEGHPLTITANGRNFYITGQRSLAAYDLDRPDAGWAAMPGAGDRKPTRDLILTQDYVVQVSQLNMANAVAEKLPAIQLQIYSRTITEGGVESGLLEQRPTLRDTSGIVANEWQITDGAFYYVSGDEKLKVVRVNR
ncbi:MAG TPA: PQQ-binding-like beta-propeller repeat protein [Tepidisphaeraceae bacterium]|jgi:outer membrane protein assembly factor BamB